MENQTKQLKRFHLSNGTKVNRVFSDVASVISFDKRKGFLKILDLIMEHRVEAVTITYKDGLIRVGFEKFNFEKILSMGDKGGEWVWT